VGAVALAMLAWSWGAWVDPVVDFGREVYVPWRLAAGERLYADLAYQYGPLSPYLNALPFLFADTWWGLLGFNLLQMAAFLAGLYFLTTRVASRGAASAAGLLVAGLFMFAQLGPLGSFNFVAPYAHAATHGVYLAFLALGAVSGYARRPGAPWAAVIGLWVGLAFLTKPEGLLGAALAGCVGLGAMWWRTRPPRARILGQGGAAVAASSLPPLLAFALLAMSMPAEVAWAGTLGSWAHGQNTALRELVGGHFYAIGLGIDDVPGRALTLLAWSLGCGAVLGACAAASWRLARQDPRARQAAVLAALVIAVLGLLAGGALREGGGASPLPLLVLAILGLEVVHLRGLEPASAAVDAAVVRLAWGALALGFLARMLFNARVSDYGFALALPASAYCAAAFTGWLPARLEAAGRAGGVLRVGAWTLGAVLTLNMLAVTHGWFGAKTERLGVSEAETLRVDARGRALQGLLEELQPRLREDETLLVLPEGVLLNYLLRRRVPTNGVTFVPTTLLLLGGEAQVLEDLRRSPPDLVAYVHRDTAEYGPDLRYFGRDYGREIDAWVRSSYTPLLQVGATPLQEDAFGVLLWERRR
jgi:hypothetical protein